MLTARPKRRVWTRVRGRARRRARRRGAVDLLPPVHPRRILLADIATLAKLTPPSSAALHSSQRSLVGSELGNALRSPQREAMRQPARPQVRPGGREPAPAEGRWRRGSSAPSVRPVGPPVESVQRDSDLPPQSGLEPAHPSDVVLSGESPRPAPSRRSINTSSPSSHRMKVEQRLALRVSRPPRAAPPRGARLQVVGHQPPAGSRAHVVARQAEHGRGRSGWFRSSSFDRGWT
jgi:hypothetical protein